MQFHVQPRSLMPAPPVPSRNDFIEALVNRFYVDEQGQLISNGLSTELVCFPSDTWPGHAQQLQTKIRDAIDYATSFRDIAALNALDCAASEVPNDYNALGLYLYLADECSRLHPDRTFLSAMREAGAEFTGEGIGLDQLRDSILKALEILGMRESHGPLLQEWFTQTTYTIQGEKHEPNSTGDPIGAYGVLAQKVSLRQKNLGMNTAISYALANKPHMCGLDAQEAFALTKKIAADDGLIAQRIAEGTRIREERIKSIIQDKIQPQPPAPNEEPEARGILSFLPDKILEILFREELSIAYANAPTIASCMPEKLPGIKPSEMKVLRNDKGLHQNRYRMVYLSNGIRENPEDIAQNTRLRHAVAAQTLLHETMHIVIGSLEESANIKLLGELKQAVEDVHGVLQKNRPAFFDQRLRTIDTDTLTEVLDYQSRLYPNYNLVDADTRWQEVACNVLGLMHAEPFCGSNPLIDPAPGMEALARLGAKVEEACDAALAWQRQQYPDLKPGPTRGPA